MAAGFSCAPACHRDRNAALTSLPRPPDHPRRRELNDEVHARQPEPITAPAAIGYLALNAAGVDRAREWQLVAALAERMGGPPPRVGDNHYSADLGGCRLAWEQHTEFTRYLVIVPAGTAPPFARAALEALPADWLAELPGTVMAAVQAAVVPTDSVPDDDEACAQAYFAGNPLVGSTIAGGIGRALTDFRVHPDGFSRCLVLDGGLTPRQAGRMVQRLLEIDTYRIMALLALPVARALTPFLNGCEQELAEIAATLIGSKEQDEPVLLTRLTRLQAELESQEAANLFRFNAASAYYELVQRRIGELREERIQGLQTFQEFTERRLAPAMNTCRLAASRLEGLSARAARATQLLSTRVDLTRERQNQALLESMDRRARMQLRLQETVEGLSVAAITYYIAGLIGYLAKAAQAYGVTIAPDLAVGISIPIVALLVALSVRKVRKSVKRRELRQGSTPRPL